MMDRAFVVISGLPGSGKTTLGRALAGSLGLLFLDKDDFLDRLFASKGVGGAAWRRTLSRESDAILEREAGLSEGAVIASHWHVHGMPADAGTPTDWIAALSRRIVNVLCLCPPDIAARRFVERTRHAGHLDCDATYDQVLAGLQALNGLGAPAVGSRVDVDTSGPIEMDSIVREVRRLLAPTSHQPSPSGSQRGVVL